MCYTNQIDYRPGVPMTERLIAVSRLLALTAAASILLLSPAIRAGSAADAPAPPGQRVVVDPDTGRIVAPPPPAAAVADEAAAAAPAARSRSDVGLQEVPMGGGAGVRVDLRGRFRTYMRATREADGSLHTDCESGTAAGAPR